MDIALQSETWGETKHDPGKVGLWFFLLSEILLFGAFFASYFILRWGSSVCALGTSVWPEEHFGPTFALATLNTLVLITSSYTIVRAYSSVKRKDHSGFSANMKATIALGAVFMAIKAVEYGLKFSHGYYPGGAFAVANPGYGIFFSFYIAMTGLHAVHILIGVVWNTLLLNSRQKRDQPEFIRKVEYAGLYWHFVDIVWVFLYPLFYLI